MDNANLPSNDIEMSPEPIEQDAVLPDAHQMRKTKLKQTLRSLWPISADEPSYYNGINVISAALRQLYLFLPKEEWPAAASEHGLVRLARSVPDETHGALLGDLKKQILEELVSEPSVHQQRTSAIELIKHPQLIRQLWVNDLYQLWDLSAFYQMPNTQKWLQKATLDPVEGSESSLIDWDGTRPLSAHMSELFGIFCDPDSGQRHLRLPSWPFAARVLYAPKEGAPAVAFADVQEFTIKALDWVLNDARTGYKLQLSERLYRLVASVGVEDSSKRSFIRLYNTDGAAMPAPDMGRCITNKLPRIGDNGYSWIFFFGMTKKGTPLLHRDQEVPLDHRQLYAADVDALTRSFFDATASVFDDNEQPTPPIQTTSKSPRGLNPPARTKPQPWAQMKTGSNPTSQVAPPNPKAASVSSLPSSSAPKTTGAGRPSLLSYLKPSGSATRAGASGAFGQVAPTFPNLGDTFWSSAPSDSVAGDRRSLLADGDRIKRPRLHGSGPTMHPDRMRMLGLDPQNPDGDSAMTSGDQDPVPFDEEPRG
ncbi:hypothetical protein SCAR479_05197 [Seiridium cardinale]|uniref:Uncharacterized protein n=1 Tax=Seiridium cardinale TaxID=138064 RepID=A0ABR2XWS8_9PEZI